MSVLILGAKGMLGGQLQKVFPGAVAWDREDVNVLEFDSLKSKILKLPETPEAVINCVAFNDVDGAEDRPDAAYALNAEFVGNLAAFCKQIDTTLVHFSTNYVFNGVRDEYAEDDEPHPLSVYGRIKYEGENLLMRNTDKYYLIRTAVLFGPKGESELSKKSFVDIMISLSERQHEIKAVDDEINSLTYVADLADAVKYLVTEHKPYGIYHVTNSECATWYGMAKELFAILKKDVTLIPVPSTEFPRKAQRPKRAVLANTKMYRLRPWQDALKEFVMKEYILNSK